MKVSNRNWQKIYIELAIVLSLLLSSCATIAQITTSEPREMEFIGNVKVGEPTTTDSRTRIPLDIISLGEIQFHSVITICDIETDQDTDKIFVTFITCVAGGSQSKNKDEIEVSLYHLEDGFYDVIYLDPNGKQHEIGMVKIN